MRIEIKYFVPLLRGTIFDSGAYKGSFVASWCLQVGCLETFAVSSIIKVPFVCVCVQYFVEMIEFVLGAHFCSFSHSISERFFAVY